MVYYFRREQEQSTAHAPGYFEPITHSEGSTEGIGRALLGRDVESPSPLLRIRPKAPKSSMKPLSITIPRRSVRLLSGGTMARGREIRLERWACILLAATISLWGSHQARADFILTRASGVYQHASGTSKVIVGSRNDAQGIFVMAGAPIPPQEFNLETTPAEGVKHIFIRFDGQAQPPTYSEVVINDKVFKVSGNLTINLGKTFIGIDNNNPYLTVVTEGATTGETPSIVGFSGLNEIVKGSGAVATILAANQLNPEVAKVILPYTVKNNELLLNEKPVTTPMVGTFVRPESECLKPGSVVLYSTDLNKITAAKSEEERIKLLEKLMADAKKSNPLHQHLVLKADPKSVILLDIREKNIHEMHEVKLKSTRQRICVVSDIVPK